MYGMSRERHINLPGHAAAEFFVGLLAILAPLVVSFGVAGSITSELAGALLIGMSLSLSTQRSVSLLGHRNFDTLFASAVAGMALVLAISGDAPAAVFFAAVTAIHVVLSAVTRYAGAT
jgi:hypothetical protein